MIERRIKNLLNDFEQFHSEFQIENFIVKNQGSPWAQYKQCLREIANRWDSVCNLIEDIDLMELDLRKTRKKFFIRSSRKIENKIKIQKKSRQLEGMKKRYIDVNKELKQFVDLAESIKFNHWGKGEISGKLKQALEQQMWIEKAKFMMAVDLMTLGGLSKQTIELVYAMPKEIKSELISHLSNEGRKKLIGWITE